MGGLFGVWASVGLGPGVRIPVPEPYEVQKAVNTDRHGLHHRWCELGQGSVVVELDWTANELRNGLGNFEDLEETIDILGFRGVVRQNLWPQ